MVKIIASGARKGNVIEHEDGKLYVVLSAENIHPGKGTPVTHLEMRRIGDGVKTVERYRTTDQVERAFIEERTYNYLYQDGEHYVFMEPTTFEQVPVSGDVLGEQKVYLTENMEVHLSLFNGAPVAAKTWARVVKLSTTSKWAYLSPNISIRSYLQFRLSFHTY